MVRTRRSTHPPHRGESWRPGPLHAATAAVEDRGPYAPRSRVPAPAARAREQYEAVPLQCRCRLMSQADRPTREIQRCSSAPCNQHGYWRAHDLQLTRSLERCDAARVFVLNDALCLCFSFGELDRALVEQARLNLAVSRRLSL